MVALLPRTDFRLLAASQIGFADTTARFAPLAQN
jgi:hypothetical protein